ncbi:hypothetical protein EVAR_40951_1 [Eumeta japonica]|uniref:Uncharacterized protein n=1 Tax=Eumeta variegata TaxID=151549 RepID=A0A4C1X3U1_EUMVA|nr:hypothetical protein EVAR_40951_1 [Eumeta japonica]
MHRPAAARFAQRFYGNTNTSFLDGGRRALAEASVFRERLMRRSAPLPLPVNNARIIICFPPPTATCVLTAYDARLDTRHRLVPVTPHARQTIRCVTWIVTALSLQTHTR